MCKKQTYDLIFSLGAAYSCTQILRRTDLQLASYPLDWLFGSDFSHRVDILCENFADFINKEDLEYTYSERSISCDAYHNKLNDLTFNHDFPTGVDLAISYPAVKEKYDRRIERLLNSIQKAQKILIAYIETPGTETHVCDADIIDGVRKIREKYADKQIDFVCLISDNTMKPKAYKTEFSQHGVCKIVGNYSHQKEGKPSWAVDARFLALLFKKYRLNMPWQARLKRFAAKTCCRVCPIKSFKEKIRKKYHV